MSRDEVLKILEFIWGFEEETHYKVCAFSRTHLFCFDLQGRPHEIEYDPTD